MLVIKTGANSTIGFKLTPSIATTTTSIFIIQPKAIATPSVNWDIKIILIEYIIFIVVAAKPAT
jgi:hypothetical protein